MWSLAFAGVVLAAGPRDDPSERQYADAVAKLAAFEGLPDGQHPANVASLYTDLLRVFDADSHASRFDRAEYRCLQAIARHPEVTKPLVRADLGSGDAKRVRHALHTLGRLKWVEFYDAVVGLIDHPDRDTARRVPYALRDLDDPRAIPLLAGRPNGLGEHMELLRNLCKGKPAFPAVTRHLSAPDADTRWRAAYALAESGDDILASHVVRLADDPDPRVREQIAVVGLNVARWGAGRLGPAFQKLLADPDPKVRVMMVSYLSERRERVCGPALLGLLRDPTLDARTAERVVEMARHLTNHALFGLTRGPDGSTVGREARTRGTPAYDAEVAKLAEWLAQEAKAGRK